jgi:hypothetical protein
MGEKLCKSQGVTAGLLLKTALLAAFYRKCGQKY